MKLAKRDTPAGFVRGDRDDGSSLRASPHKRLSALARSPGTVCNIPGSGALDRVREVLVTGGMLREVVVSEAMPKRRPWG